MSLRRHRSSLGRSVAAGLTLAAAVTACTSPPSGEGEPPARVIEPGCINACYYDELPPPVDCAAAEADTEFYPLNVWSMERDGVASNMYHYTDNTAPFEYLSPNSWEPPANSTLEWPGGVNDAWPFNPDLKPASVLSIQRCLAPPKNTNNVLHLFGGPFTEWGGGVGRGLKCLNQSSTLGRVKVGDDTMLPTSASGTTDPSCGAGPDAYDEGRNEVGACAPTQDDELIRSACPERDLRAAEEGPESAGEEEFLLGMTLDLSDWDGISFWARRSPNSQPGIRIALGDRYTDDDLRYLQYHINPDSKPLCERRRECGCLNNRPCSVDVSPVAGEYCEEDAQCNYGQGGPGCDTEVGRCGCTRDQECPGGWCEPEPDGVYGATGYGHCRAMSYCYDPAIDPYPEAWVSAGGERVFVPCARDADCADGESCVATPYGGRRVCASPEDPKPVSRVVHAECGEAACNAFYKPFQVGDAQFNGRACTPFAFRGSTSNSFCFDPGQDRDPPEGVDLCGDFWMAPVYLSTEWQFYKVPFTELHQQGWAKEQFQFDLTSISVVRFTWDRGWVDYWIDDVRFYRDTR